MNRWTSLLVAALAAVPALRTAPAGADQPMLSLRQVTNVGHFDEVEQHGVQLLWPGRDRLQVLGHEYSMDWIVSAGVLRWEAGHSGFVSVGRGVSIQDFAGLRRTTLQVSVSPTWIETPVLNGQDLGGHLHFTTAVTWMIYLDRRREQFIALRAQHTSNAGTQDRNPGLDMAGIEIGWRFGGAAVPDLARRPPFTLSLDFSPREDAPPKPFDT